MIDRTEILGLANDLGLQPRVVEKDYILGWVLAGIAWDEELARVFGCDVAATQVVASARAVAHAEL